MKPPNKRTFPPRPSLPTSWETAEKWYQEAVGEEGLYYHKHIVIPGVRRLLDLEHSSTASLLDVACGQGILARHIPNNIDYIGLDISSSLVKSAKQVDQNPRHQYVIADATKPFSLKKKDFSHAAVILAVQNMQEPLRAFENIANHLIPGGKLVIAMNHPCFRIPRQSSWKIDEQQKVQYRRIDRYSSPLDIPIQVHPSKGKESPQTWSFHRPLSAYSLWLNQAGFAIELIEEWHSNKVSTGKAAKMENRSRAEIPLFLAIRAIRM